MSSENKRYITAYIPLFLTICLFWAVWFQVYTVATVYFDETVDRTIGGWTVPIAWKDSIQSMWVVLFSGVMAAIWTKMGKHLLRSEERRVGKECRSRWSPYH